MAIGRTARKKCSELRPVCFRCLRNALSCTWPTGNQLIDRRSRKPPNTSGAKSSNSSSAALYEAAGESNNLELRTSNFELEIPSSVGLIKTQLLLDETETPSSTLPRMLQLSPFESAEQYAIFTHFAESFLPSLVHRGAHPQYRNQDYMLSLGFEYPPLMNAMLACSAMNLACSSNYYQPTAVRNYVSALRSMRKDIQDGRLTGTEDYLLATTVCLCVFEVRLTYLILIPHC